MIEIDRLIACALGEDDDEVELHILACSTCAERFAAFARLGPAVAALVRTGAAATPATRALVARLDAEGLITRRYALAPGSVVPCTVGPEDICSLTVFEVPGDVTTVDVQRGDIVLRDVPVDGGHVYMVTPASLIRTYPTMQIPFRISSGGRTLGEYTLDHTALHSAP